MPSSRGAASTSVTRTAATSSSRKSFASTFENSSIIAPDVSTPVGPPPHTTTSSAPRPTSAGSAVADSKRSSTVRRNVTASSRSFNAIVCSATPGTPYVVDTAPAATISESYGIVSGTPPLRSTLSVRSSRSTPTTRAMWTVTLRWRRKMPRTA